MQEYRPSFIKAIINTITGTSGATILPMSTKTIEQPRWSVPLHEVVIHKPSPKIDRPTWA